MSNRFGRVMSLGALCTSKYQARRVLAARQGLDIDPQARSAVPGAPNAVFDWQITPFPALLEYLRRDLAGMYERDDLVIRNGHVANQRYGTVHPHEFPTGPNEADLSATYPLARSRHDHLVARACSILKDDTPTLYLYSKSLSGEEQDELSALLARFNPAKRFGLLVVGDASKGWRGNNVLWDEALAAHVVEPVEESRVAKSAVGPFDYAAAQYRRFRRHVQRLKF